MREFIIAIGTNTNCYDNIVWTKARLFGLFPDIRFSHFEETSPINMKGANFLNAVALGHTQFSVDDLKFRLKELESLCGDTKEKRIQGNVEMDIDLLQYENIRYHEKDWERPYIQELMKEIL